ncbi:hypothetical protein LCGC14_1396680 [marine sediment metagenome]|uniref:Uncharacterized protein n=1 Tax=marine sediment metagenome TaxID=412755 RepID=A0A0F9MDY4_9ZZZZ
MTHTPEHWTVDYDETPWTSGDCRTAVEVGDDFGPVEILFSIRDGEGDVVCYCPWYPLAADQEQEELRSKARLIATAPELLAALKELVTEFDADSDRAAEQPGYIGLAETGGLILARAAIIKAKATP